MMIDSYSHLRPAPSTSMMIPSDVSSNYCDAQLCESNRLRVWAGKLATPNAGSIDVRDQLSRL